MYSKIALAAIALLVLPAIASAEEGDAKKGEKVFKKCHACHDATTEKNKVGPHLVGIVGRKFASVEGYKYSKPAMHHAEEGGVWSEEEIFKYLADPSAYLGGRSKMTFKLKKEDQRRDVIAYLKSLAPEMPKEEMPKATE